MRLSLIYENNTGEPFLAKAYRGMKKGDLSQEMTFWSPDESVAAAYAGRDGNVVEKMIEFKNPIVADNWVQAKKQMGLPLSTSMPDLQKEASRRGYDGIIFRSHNGKPEYVQLSLIPISRSANPI